MSETADSAPDAMTTSVQAASADRAVGWGFAAKTRVGGFGETRAECIGGGPHEPEPKIIASHSGARVGLVAC